MFPDVQSVKARYLIARFSVKWQPISAIPARIKLRNSAPRLFRLFHLQIEKRKSPREKRGGAPPPPPHDKHTMNNVDTESSQVSKPPIMSSEEIRFLADVAIRPLSTTVSRYQRLNLSRRRGNAIRQRLGDAGIIEAIAIATRSGQVVLAELTDHGRTCCRHIGIDVRSPPRTSLEHQFWVRRSAEHFERKGFDVSHECSIRDNGIVDLVAQRPGERIAIEVETGKSDIQGNVEKLLGKDFDRIVLIATSPTAISACQRVVDGVDPDTQPLVELLTWLDVS